MSEQHFQYRWDELNRISEARRYDREGGVGDWDLAARMRARYDSGNVRLVKQSIDPTPASPEVAERFHVYAYPGDFERLGVTADHTVGVYLGSSDLGTEAEFHVAGAKVVYKAAGPSDLFDRNQRATVAIGDLLGSASAVVDVDSGGLLEMATLHPNGGREMHWMSETDRAVRPRNSFTGKEDDEEVGIAYFGHRYLVARIGRWASPDPLSIHGMGGGESINSYHYVGGSPLQLHDPDGLSIPVVRVAVDTGSAGSGASSSASAGGSAPIDSASAPIARDEDGNVTRTRTIAVFELRTSDEGAARDAAYLCERLREGNTAMLRSAGRELYARGEISRREWRQIRSQARRESNAINVVEVDGHYEIVATRNSGRMSEHFLRLVEMSEAVDSFAYVGYSNSASVAGLSAESSPLGASIDTDRGNSISAIGARGGPGEWRQEHADVDSHELAIHGWRSIGGAGLPGADAHTSMVGSERTNESNLFRWALSNRNGRVGERPRPYGNSREGSSSYSDVLRAWIGRGPGRPALVPISRE